ncbi:MAG: nucleotidyltransferase [Bacteroidetes bacterium]|nr:MAG: nucleotidyltransferase [Bacteroidota bacterium]
MKPTLLILAAGLGSRYGGVKQMDKIGPSGESIIDYSVFDAIRAGFGKVVFVVNPKIIDDFKSIYEPRLKGKIETSYVLQEIENIPEGIKFNPERVKPWGTAHAVLVAKDEINEPFAVINADDFYGKEAYETIADFLVEQSNKTGAFAMVGYKLKNTLSDFGSVSRGVCEIENKLLTDVVERTSIVRKDGGIVFEDNGKEVSISNNAIVSMNFWGFTPDFFEQTEKDFKAFIVENASQLKAEFYIPYVVNNLIQNKEVTVEVLTSDAKWFGITYQEDKAITIQEVSKLVDMGIYPKSLWG